MRAMLAVVLVCCVFTGLQAAGLQNIEEAHPLNVDLSSQSDTALANIAGTEIDEDKLGGYRPLYPPYFQREPTTQSSGAQPKSVYYDQEYYTRGAHPGLTDDRLDRRPKIAAGGNPFLPSNARPALPNVKSVIPEPTLVQPALTGDYNNRQAKIGPVTNPFLPGSRPAFAGTRAVVSVVQPPLTGVQPVITDDRNNRQIEITNSHFSHAASSSFSSSYSFSSVKFPSS